MERVLPNRSGDPALLESIMRTVRVSHITLQFDAASRSVVLFSTPSMLTDCDEKALV